MFNVLLFSMGHFSTRIFLGVFPLIFHKNIYYRVAQHCNTLPQILLSALFLIDQHIRYILTCAVLQQAVLLNSCLINTECLFLFYSIEASHIVIFHATVYYLVQEVMVEEEQNLINILQMRN